MPDMPSRHRADASDGGGKARLHRLSRRKRASRDEGGGARSSAQSAELAIVSESSTGVHRAAERVVRVRPIRESRRSSRRAGLLRRGVAGCAAGLQSPTQTAFWEKRRRFSARATTAMETRRRSSRSLRPPRGRSRMERVRCFFLCRGGRSRSRGSTSAPSSAAESRKGRSFLTWAILTWRTRQANRMFASATADAERGCASALA